MPKQIYMDYAAATPLDKKVLAAMQAFWQGEFYNPSGLYTSARTVRRQLEAARSSVAKVLGSKSSEVIFTAGATESINLALHGLAGTYPGSNVVISALEHEAVVAGAHAAFGARVKVCPVSVSGLVDQAKLRQLVDSKTVLVSIIYASNEIGTIQPLAKMAQLVRTIARGRTATQPLYLHSDASQAANYLDLKVNRLGVDLLTLNGGKIYGPKQSGGLYIKAGIQLAPLIAGGGQEHGLRSGTENVAGSIGFAKALELAAQLRAKESARLTALRDQLVSKLLEIEGVQLNGSRRLRLPNNVNVSIKGVEGETLVHYLDHAGVLAATGAACSASKDVPSPTLLAIGCTRAQANSSLRLTLGRQTTAAEVEAVARTVAKLVDRLRHQS